MSNFVWLIAISASGCRAVIEVLNAAMSFCTDCSHLLSLPLSVTLQPQPHIEKYSDYLFTFHIRVSQPDHI